MPVLGYCQESTRLGFEFDSVTYSEATSIYSISGNWNDRVAAGDEAFSVSRLYLGLQKGPISLQYVNRSDIYYNYANDTAQLISLTENQQPLQAGDQYRLYIKADSLDSRGIRIGYSSRVKDNLEVKAFFSLLKPTDIDYGSLEGSAQAIDDNDYDFNFHSDLVYQEDPLYERPSEGLSGQGYSIDFAIHYIVNEKWDLKMELFDLAGEIKFDDAPFTTGDATSDIKDYDDDGYVKFDPVVTGLEGNKSFTYKFNMQSHFTVGYKLPDKDSIVLQHHEYSNSNFQQLSYVQQFDTNQLAWNWIPEFQAAGITFNTPQFSIRLITDDLDYKEMKFLSLASHFYWVFD